MTKAFPSIPQWMHDDLATSGISLEEATKRGWHPTQDGYVIPFLDPESGLALPGPNGMPFERTKLRFQRSGGAKYLSPKGSGIFPYVPAEVHQQLVENSSAPVYLTEGEKKSLSALLRGLYVIGLTGIEMWRESGSDALHPLLQRYATPGRSWIMIFDSDGVLPSKAKHFQGCARKLGKALAVYKCPLHVVFLPSLPGFDKVGLDDYFVGGKTVDDLMAHIKQTAPLPLLPDGRALTSATNGQNGGRPRVPMAELATGYAETQRDADGNLRLRAHLGRWWKYNGTHYREVPAGDVEADLMTWLRRNQPDHATTTCQSNVIANLRSTDLCGLPSTAKIPFWIENGYPPASGWLPMQDNVVNIAALARYKQGEDVAPNDLLRNHTPLLFSTVGLPYAFDPEATCPKWLCYLKGVQPKQKDRTVLQQIAGLLLIPDTRFNVAFFLFGEAGTGKSVCLHVLLHLVGEKNVCSIPLSRFAERFGLGPLTRCLANVVGDMPTVPDDGKVGEVEGVLKEVCDGGWISDERKFEDPVSAPAMARCVFGTNSLPRFTDRSSAIWDRIRIVSFEQRFRNTKRDNKNLRYELVAEELPGILNWALDGLALLLRNPNKPFPEHSAGAERKLGHRQLCDHERVFLEETCIRGGPTASLDSAELYQEYRAWCQANGYCIRHEGNFGQAVRRVFGVDKVRTRDGGVRRTVYQGLRRKTEVED